MAVKPLTQPLYWATDPVYSTGPFIGQPQKVIPPGAFAAEGHRPGSLFPTPAEYENSQQYNLTGLARWVFLGSSAGAADAHIVETDGTGRATMHGLTVTNTTTQTPVFATGNGVLAPVYRATNPNGGDGYVADLSGSTGSAFYSEISADSKGLEIEMDTVVAGVGVLVTADAATTAEALTITHDGSTNHAASITTTGASTMCLRLDALDDAGLYVDGGGPGGSAAILAVGKTDAAGVRGSGGPSGANGVEGFGTGSGTAGVFGLADQYGVSGLSTNSTSGFGVYGESDNTAGIGAGGVHGNAVNNGIGVFGQAVDGYGGMFTADGARQTVFMTPRIADPSSTLTGGFWNRTTRGISTFVANVARLVWHSAGGAATTSAWDAGPGTADDTTGVVLTCTLSAADSPLVAGTVWLLFSVEIGRTSGTPNALVEVGDATAPDFYVQDTIQLFQTAGAGVYERHVSYVIPYPLPATGNRTFTATLLSNTPGDDINYRRMGLTVIGVF